MQLVTDLNLSQCQDSRAMVGPNANLLSESLSLVQSSEYMQYSQSPKKITESSVFEKLKRIELP